MADTSNNADTPVKPVDAPKDVHNDAGSHETANHDASVKGASEVYSGAAAPKDAAPAVAAEAGKDAATPAGDAKDATTAADPASDTSWVSKMASDAWSGTVAGIDSFQNWFDASATPAAGNDASKSDSKGYIDFLKNDWVPVDTKGSSDAPAQVNVQAGEVKVNNAELSMTRGTNGADTVTEKGTGNEYTRNPDHSITEKSADATSTMSKEAREDNFGFFHFERQLGSALPADNSNLPPGEARQGSNGIVYSNTFHNADGGGTITANNKDRTITMQQDDGDKLVLDGKTQEATFTAKGGQPETMSMDEFRRKHGDTFAHFHLDRADHVHNDKEGVNIETNVAGAKLTRVNANGGDAVTALSNADGTSDLKHTDAQGNFVSESKVNYNDPAHGFQEIDKSGKVASNFDLNNDKFCVGNDFTFSDAGTFITDGSIFVGNDGSFTASSSDAISSDGSVAYDGPTDAYGSDAYGPGEGTSDSTASSGIGGQALNGMSEDRREEVASVMQSARSEVGAAMAEAGSITAAPGAVDASMLGSLSGAEDTVQGLMDATGGRLQLSSLLANIQNKESNVSTMLDRGSDQDGSANGVKFVDFSKDIYAA